MKTKVLPRFLSSVSLIVVIVSAVNGNLLGQTSTSQTAAPTISDLNWLAGDWQTTGARSKLTNIGPQRPEAQCSA